MSETRNVITEKENGGIQESGKYLVYMRSLEGSGIVFGNDVEELKGQWCSLYKSVFETDGLTMKRLKAIFAEKPEVGTIEDWLVENKKLVFTSKPGGYDKQKQLNG